MPVRSRSGSRTLVWRLLAVLLALGLVAAACGGDDDDSGGGGTDTTAGGGGSTETTEAAGEPTPGGSLVMGIEADTSSPWTPSKAVCAVSCHAVMRAVYDPLTLIDEDGNVIPNLATVEPNADYTVWTITAQPGVTFHDGTPFDGAAIADNLARQQASFLTGKVLTDVTAIEVDPADPMKVNVTMSRPWVAFDYYLSAQIGYMASPTWMAAADSDPSLESKPVGTGPFVFDSYQVGQSFKASKNPDYWQEGYPYLDSIEYRIIPDGKTRENALLAGDLDAMHTTTGETIANLREQAAEYPMIESTQWGETGYWLMHVTQEGSPLTDQRVRCALAYATDVETIRQATGAGVADIANGPYSPEQIGYLEDTGYPTYDVEQAKALVDEYEAENGPIELAYATTNDATNLQTAQLIEQMWKDVGIDISIEQIEQGQFIVTALQGDFQVFLWRNHGGSDPDGQYVWWTSDNALPVGQLALNFGRIKDDVIDENLDIIRSNPDPAARQAAAEAINRQFGEQCYNLWGTWTVWAIPHTPSVMGIEDYLSPDGTAVAEAVGTTSGSFFPQSVWIQQ